MPVIDRNNPTGQRFLAAQQEGLTPVDPRGPTSSQVWGAAFRRENVIGSLMSRELSSNNEWDFEFEPLTSENLTGYEDYRDRFIDVRNRDQNEALKRQIDRERVDAQTLARGGLGAIGAQIVAGTIDPTIFIPIGGAVKKGESLLRIGARLAAGAGGGAAVSEGLLHMTQETRTAGESVMAVGGSALLMGVAGPAITAGWRGVTGKPVFGFDPETMRATSARIEQEMVYDPEGDPQFAFAREEAELVRGEGLSSQASPEVTLDDYQMANSLGVGGVTSALHLSPVVRVSRSISAKARDVINRLLENGTYLNRNLEGRASPVAAESSRIQYTGWHATAEEAVRNAYKAGRKAGGAYSQREFFAEVGMAHRRGDQHPDASVRDAATAYRSVLDRLRDEGINNRLLPEDVDIKTAPSYFHRLWNHEVLMRRPNQFRQMVSAWANDEFAKIRARANEIRMDLERLGAKPSPEDADFLKKADELDQIIDVEGEDYALQVADDVYDTLMGYDARSMPTNIPAAKRGPLAERTFSIPDLFEFEGVRVEDFLVNDAQEVMDRYVRVMGTDIELARQFGTPDMKEVLDDIGKEYAELARQAKTEAEAARINRERESIIKEIEGMRDVMRGTYGPPTYDSNWRRGAAIVRAWNYVTMLGGMLVSALPDISGKVLGHGVLGVTRDLLVPMITNMKAVKMSAKEARRLGIATERLLATRIASMADIGDVYGRGSSFERAVGAMTNHFSKWTGMRLWNDVMKQADYLLATSRAVRIMERPDRASKADAAWLANLGIGEAEYGRIMRQVRKYGDTDNGMRLTNADQWDDAEARRIWIGAMGKNANIQTVTPGIGDRFLAFHGDAGKTIGQFKSFALAANNRVTTRAAQQAAMGDGKVASFFVTAVSLGMVVYWAKMLASGREPSDDPATWVREGIDRSGVISVFMEGFNTAEKISGHTFVGESPASRYASRGKFASMLGPSVGRGEDALSLIAGLADGDLKDRDIHAIRKLLPYNNLFYARTILDDLEIMLSEGVGAEETRLSENREPRIIGR